MKRRAYVNRAHGTTKVILGDDEWQIEFSTVEAAVAKTKISRGDFNAKDVVPAEIDPETSAIRAELRRLCDEVEAIYDDAEKGRYGSFVYDKETRDKADKLAFRITDTQRNGI